MNLQLMGCFLMKVSSLKIHAFLFYPQHKISEGWQNKCCNNPFLFPPLPPTFPKPENSEKGRVKVSLWSQSSEIESFFIWSCPPVAMVTQHLLQWSLGLASSKLLAALYFAWHATLFPEECIAPFQQRNLYWKGGLQRKERLSLCKLQFWESKLSCVWGH